MIRVLVSVVALVLVAGCDKKQETPAAGDKTKSEPAASAPAAAVQGEVKGKKVPIAVGEDGFAPNEVKVGKGEEATLVFTRTSDKTCAKDVEFPELKLTKALPLNQPVAVVVPSGEARTLTFQCGMGMYKSKVVVQ